MAKSNRQTGELIVAQFGGMTTAVASASTRPRQSDLNQNGDLGLEGAWALRKGLVSASVDKFDEAIDSLAFVEARDGAITLIQHGDKVYADKIGTSNVHRVWSAPLPRQNFPHTHLINFTAVPRIAWTWTKHTSANYWRIQTLLKVSYPDYASGYEAWFDGELLTTVRTPDGSSSDTNLYYADGSYTYKHRYIMLNGAVGPFSPAFTHALSW